MGRHTEYSLKKNASALLGGPTGEVIIDVDMATIGASEDITIHDSFSGGVVFASVQVISVGLTGTVNSSGELIRSNDGENYDPTGVTVAANGANGSDYAEIIHFTGAFLGATITKGTVTGGILRLAFMVKHN